MKKSKPVKVKTSAGRIAAVVKSGPGSKPKESEHDGEGLKGLCSICGQNLATHPKCKCCTTLIGVNHNATYVAEIEDGILGCPGCARWVVLMKQNNPAWTLARWLKKRTDNRSRHNAKAKRAARVKSVIDAGVQNEQIHQ